MQAEDRQLVAPPTPDAMQHRDRGCEGGMSTPKWMPSRERRSFLRASNIPSTVAPRWPLGHTLLWVHNAKAATSSGNSDQRQKVWRFLFPVKRRRVAGGATTTSGTPASTILGTHAKHESRIPFGPQTLQKRTSNPIFCDCWSDCVIWTVDGQWTDSGRYSGR